MTDASSAILTLYFRCRLLQAAGTAFQDFFNDLMHYSCPGFCPVAPWGTEGDRGNDGWVPEQGHFYQLYAPMPTKNWQPPTAAAKAVVDFKKLLTAYSVKAYFFVLNDRFSGVPAPVGQAMQKIIASHPGVLAQHIGSHALLGRFEALTSEKKAQLLHGVPSAEAHTFDVSLLAETIRSLAQNTETFPLLGPKLAPEFDAKLQFNKLGPDMQDLLRHYARLSGRVDEVIRALNDQGLKQDIATELNSRYKVISSDGGDADDCLIRLVETLVPESVRSSKVSLKSYREAGLLVIAKYFETCDVFENPISAAAT